MPGARLTPGAQMCCMERRITAALEWRLTRTTPWMLVLALLEMPGLKGSAELKNAVGFLHAMYLQSASLAGASAEQVAAALLCAAMREVLPDAARDFESARLFDFLLGEDYSGGLLRGDGGRLAAEMARMPARARRAEGGLAAVMRKFGQPGRGGVAGRLFLR